MKNKIFAVGAIALMSAVVAHAGTNEKSDILRCEVTSETSTFDANGNLVSGSSHPVTVMVADSRFLSAGIGYKYKGKDYTLGIGISGLIATQGMPATTVAVSRGKDLVMSVDVANLVDKMNNGTYSYESIRSNRVKMPSGESLSIYCSGRSERQQLINSANAVEALYEKAFGATTN